MQTPAKRGLAVCSHVARSAGGVELQSGFSWGVQFGTEYESPRRIMTTIGPQSLRSAHGQNNHGYGPGWRYLFETRPTCCSLETLLHSISPWRAARGPGQAPPNRKSTRSAHEGATKGHGPRAPESKVQSRPSFIENLGNEQDGHEQFWRAARRGHR